MIGPVTDEFGNKYWRNETGHFHREDGPAIEYENGSKCWLINGERHREDGPAIEYADGRKVWYINGKYIFCKTQEEFDQLMKLSLFW